jgi:hypothetical protein
VAPFSGADVRLMIAYTALARSERDRTRMHSSTRLAGETVSERGGGGRKRFARRVGAATGQAYDAPRDDERY